MGYWQIEVEEESKPKTTFITNRDLFESYVMSYELCARNISEIHGICFEKKAI